MSELLEIDIPCFQIEKFLVYVARIILESEKLGIGEEIKRSSKFLILKQEKTRSPSVVISRKTLFEFSDTDSRLVRYSLNDVGQVPTQPEIRLRTAAEMVEISLYNVLFKIYKHEYHVYEKKMALYHKLTCFKSAVLRSLMDTMYFVEAMDMETVGEILDMLYVAWAKPCLEDELIEQVFKLKLGPNDRPDHHFIKLENLFYQIEMSGRNFSETEKVSHMLESLRSTYPEFVSAATFNEPKNYFDTKRYFFDVKHVLTPCKRSMSDSDDDNCDKIGNSNNRKPPAKKARPRSKCGSCGRTGHDSDECYKNPHATNVPEMYKKLHALTIKKLFE